MGGRPRRLESGSTKRGEEHHIATGHGPMVQGGLLTADPGGVHGYGWSPGAGSSSRQGAGAATPGSPILKRRRAERGEVAGKTPILGVSTPRAKYRQRGHREDPRGSQEGPWRGPGWGCATCPPGCLVVALLHSFGDSRSFRWADFLSE